MRIIFSIIAPIFLLLNTFHVFAASDEEYIVYNEAFHVIDQGDSTENVYLTFGAGFNESIFWNTTSSRFEFTDDVYIQDNIEVNGDSTFNGTITVGGLTYNFPVSHNGSGDVLTNDGSGNLVWQDVSSVITGTTLAPYISTGQKNIQPSQSGTIVVTGGNFDYDTQVSIPSWEGTIDAIRYISSEEIEIDVTAGATETCYDLVLINSSKDSTGYLADNGLGALCVAVSSWLDLRLGGDVFTVGNGAGNDIRHRAGMTVSRDANGMFFTGSTPWSSWVKFESLSWARGTNQTVEWIFTAPTSFMMIGIGSTATNETATDQYRQGEVEAYFNSSTQFWGLYGNNGTPGATGNQTANTAISSTGVFKVKFEGDGDAGDTFTLYEIPSASDTDWDDETTVITTFTIGGTLNPNETNIMPFIIPQNGGVQRFLAVKVEP